MKSPLVEKIEQRLQAMTGKVFMYKSGNYRIMSYDVETERVIIATDRKVFKVTPAQAMPLLADFLPVDETETLPIAANDKFLEMIRGSVTLGSAAQLRETLMINLKKVQDDPSYIPQAQAVNQTVSTIIDLAKAEVDMINAAAKLYSSRS